MQMPGKEVRSQLIAAFNKWLRVPPAAIDSIKTIIRMLHVSSLMYALQPYLSSACLRAHRIDDIEDNSRLRRC
jgi:geranylgeranyl diphosphate synthase type 3